MLVSSTGGWGAGGADPRISLVKQMLVEGHSLRLLDEAWGRASAAPKIKKSDSQHMLNRHRPVRERKKYININKLVGLSWDWVGAKILFMLFMYVFRVIPYGGEEKHTNKVPPPKSRDSPVKILFTCFYFTCVCVCVCFFCGFIKTPVFNFLLPCDEKEPQRGEN